MEKFVLPYADKDKTVLKTIRLKTTTLELIEELSIKTNLPVNRIFTECIEFALRNIDETELAKHNVNNKNENKNSI